MVSKIFAALGIVMLLVFLITSLIARELNHLNLHLTAYGFILAGIGYIIELLKSKDDAAADHLKYVLMKHNKELQDDIRSVRMMILKQEERKRKGPSDDPADNAGQ